MSTASIAISPAERQRSPLIRLYRGQTRFDFVRKRRWWFAASSLVILAGLISLGVKGLNYSIEFVGGLHGKSRPRALPSPRHRVP